jgi:Zn finger protein HypA/HybF involved in hydrogenase expression
MNEKWGKDAFGGRISIAAEVVNGTCPTCVQEVVLVSLTKNHYRCVTCGSDLEQKVNGVISYIPMGDPNTKMVLRTDGTQEA